MVIKEQLERVRVLRLANPPGNVLNLRLLETLRGEVEQAAGDPEVRALVLASSYPRYFSTGLDLEEMSSRPRAQQTEHFMRLLDVYRALRELPKPTVAAIGGSALLGGWILAMGCDFRLLSDDGKVNLAEIRAGLSPSPYLIARLREIAASSTVVKEMVLKGRTLRAEEALAGGIVDAVIAADQLQDEALKEARLLAKQAPRAYAEVKKALSWRTPAEAQALWKESRDGFAALFETEDAQEGLAALREKRRPRYAET